MTLDQLQVLQTIIQTGSFRSASQSLHRAQSAVSYAVRNLEEELGFKLFSRDQYRPQLTPQGRAFAFKVDDLIAQYAELEETAHFLKRGHEPLIRIAVSAIWPLPLLVGALKEFKKRYAQTEIKIISDVLSNDEQILEDRADLALGVIYNDQGLLVVKELFPVKMPAVCSARHPLAKLQGKAPEAELARHPQIIMANSLATSSRSGGIINARNVISVQDYLTKKTFLEEGLGWGLMPEHLILEDLKKKKLVKLTPKSRREMTHLARHSKKELGPCGKFLWDYFSNRQKSLLK